MQSGSKTPNNPRIASGLVATTPAVLNAPLIQVKAATQAHP